MALAIILHVRRYILNAEQSERARELRATHTVALRQVSLFAANDLCTGRVTSCIEGFFRPYWKREDRVLIQGDTN